MTSPLLPPTDMLLFASIFGEQKAREMFAKQCGVSGEPAPRIPAYFQSAVVAALCDLVRTGADAGALRLARENLEREIGVLTCESSDIRSTAR